MPAKADQPRMLECQLHACHSGGAGNESLLVQERGSDEELKWRTVDVVCASNGIGDSVGIAFDTSVIRSGTTGPQTAAHQP